MEQNIWAILICKDEEDVAYHVLTHLAEEGCSGIIVADNMSTDSTMTELLKAQEVLKDSPCQVVILTDDEVGYYQSQKMTNLAHKAHDHYGATWILPVDFDEVWYSREGSMKDVIEALPDNIDIVEASLFNHFATALDTDDVIPFKSMQWRQPNKGALPKMAFRYHSEAIIKQGNHSIDLPFKPNYSDCLEIRHFPYRSWEHFKRKATNGAAAYAATDLPITEGQHWRNYFSLIQSQGEEAVKREVWERYFHFFSPLDSGLIYDPAPFRRWNHNL